MNNKKQCPNCQKEFVPRRTHHLFCTKGCCDKYNKTKTWESFFQSLINNSSVARKDLSVTDLRAVFDKQGGKCALSGVPLTKIAGQGTVSTNASIDRIKPSGPYIKSNVRLVCGFVNGFRSNVSDKDFIWWCNKIAEFNE